MGVRRILLACAGVATLYAAPAPEGEQPWHVDMTTSFLAVDPANEEAWHTWLRQNILERTWPETYDASKIQGDVPDILEGAVGNAMGVASIELYKCTQCLMFPDRKSYSAGSAPNCTDDAKVQKCIGEQNGIWEKLGGLTNRARELVGDNRVDGANPFSCEQEDPELCRKRHYEAKWHSEIKHTPQLLGQAGSPLWVEPPATEDDAQAAEWRARIDPLSKNARFIVLKHTLRVLQNQVVELAVDPRDDAERAPEFEANRLKKNLVKRMMGDTNHLQITQPPFRCEKVAYCFPNDSVKPTEGYQITAYRWNDPEEPPTEEAGYDTWTAKIREGLDEAGVKAKITIPWGAEWIGVLKYRWQFASYYHTRCEQMAVPSHVVYPEPPTYDTPEACREVWTALFDATSHRMNMLARLFGMPKIAHFGMFECHRGVTSCQASAYLRENVTWEYTELHLGKAGADATEALTPPSDEAEKEAWEARLKEVYPDEPPAEGQTEAKDKTGPFRSRWLGYLGHRLNKIARDIGACLAETKDCSDEDIAAGACDLSEVEEDDVLSCAAEFAEEFVEMEGQYKVLSMKKKEHAAGSQGNGQELHMYWCPPTGKCREPGEGGITGKRWTQYLYSDWRQVLPHGKEGGEAFVNFEMPEKV